MKANQVIQQFLAATAPGSAAQQQFVPNTTGPHMLIKDACSNKPNGTSLWAGVWCCNGKTIPAGYICPIAGQVGATAIELGAHPARRAAVGLAMLRSGRF